MPPPPDEPPGMPPPDEPPGMPPPPGIETPPPPGMPDAPPLIPPLPMLTEQPPIASAAASPIASEDSRRTADCAWLYVFMDLLPRARLSVTGKGPARNEWRPAIPDSCFDRRDNALVPRVML